MSFFSGKRLIVALGLSPIVLLGAAWLPGFAHPSASIVQGADGPVAPKKPQPIRRGNANAGREVFRFETFGDEGFWTDAARLPQGMKAAGITVLDALDSGVQIDADRVAPHLD